MEFMNILRCPECNGNVEQNGDCLICLQCSARYSIIEGIPIMRVGGEKTVYEDIKYAMTFDVQRTGARLDLRRRALIHEIVKLAQIRSDTKTLSVGAGTGLYEQFLDCDLVVSDYSLAMLTLARQKGLKRLICADALQLPFQENFFDCVMSFGCSTLLHEKSAITTIREMKRVTKKRGQLIIGFQNIMFNRIKGALCHANPRYDQHGVSPMYLAKLFKEQDIIVVNNLTYVSSDRKFYSATNRFLDKLGIFLGPTVIIQGKV